MANYVTVTSDKKKWVAFFLCLFLGCFGAHYFYVLPHRPRHCCPFYHEFLLYRLYY